MFVSGVKLLLTVIFLHRCIVIYDRWSLGRTEKLQSSQAFTGHEPFPAITFKAHIRNNIHTGENLKSFVSQANFHDGADVINLLNDTEEYFTELIANHKRYTVYYLTFNLPKSDLPISPKAKLNLHVVLDAKLHKFPFSVHPPHHMWYGQSVLDGLHREYVTVDKVQAGETQSIVYSFTLTKTIKRDGCSKNEVPLDACQILFIEEYFGCKLPWLRGKKTGQSRFDNVCSNTTLANMTTVMAKLKPANIDRLIDETGCTPNCQLYEPKITKEATFIHHQKFTNDTDRKLLDLSFYTDQLLIPVEEIILSYDNLDAMADIGGYLGLLLGASCLSMVKNMSERFSKVLKSWRLAG